MGVRRIVGELDFRRATVVARSYWRGWSESDLASLSQKLDEPSYYSGGIVSITVKEHRAWPELNRRVKANNNRALRSALLAWVAGRGLHAVVRVHGPVDRPSP